MEAYGINGATKHENGCYTDTHFYDYETWLLSTRDDLRQRR